MCAPYDIYIACMRTPAHHDACKMHACHTADERKLHSLQHGCGACVRRNARASILRFRGQLCCTCPSNSLCLRSRLSPRPTLCLCTRLTVRTHVRLCDCGKSVQPRAIFFFSASLCSGLAVHISQLCMPGTRRIKARFGLVIAACESIEALMQSWLPPPSCSASNRPGTRTWMKLEFFGTGNSGS